MQPCATTLEAEMTAEEHQLLLETLRREHFRGPHLEVGTAAGGTLCRMMRCFDDEHRPPFVVVDRMTYFPSQLEAVQRNLRQSHLDPEQVDFRVATSSKGYTQAEKRGDAFDFILIDASHKIHRVTADLRWTRLLNVGGIVCLHDYSPRFPGVTLPVDRFLARQPNYSVIGQAGSLLALRKSSASSRPEVTMGERVFSMVWYFPSEARRKLDKWEQRRARAA